MRRYINKDSKGKLLPSRDKVSALLADGAIRTTNRFQPNLVCVVENGPFDAAAYCPEEQDYIAFTHSEDRRVKHWLVFNKANELAD